MNWLEKCRLLKTGLKQTEPNENISKNYLLQAEKTLERVKKLIDDDDFLWASVTTYYCAYYALYAFLQKVGAKSENHSCSIELFEYLTNRTLLVKNIKNFKETRIDSQYYLNIPDKAVVLQNYDLLKNFYVELYNLCNSDDVELMKIKHKLNTFFTDDSKFTTA